MRVQVTRAVWDPRGEGPYVSEYAVRTDDIDLVGDDLSQAVHEQEASMQDDEYHSVLSQWVNGSVEVKWDRGSQPLANTFRTGLDLYREATDQGALLGGCLVHESWECWDPSAWPPPGRAQRWHVEIGPLVRLQPHQACWWRESRGSAWTHVRQQEFSVALDRCCDRPFALTTDEATAVATVCRDISTYLPFDGGPLTNVELILGWRLFGVYERGNVWPGVNWKADRIDPDVLEGWWIMNALQTVGTAARIGDI